MRDALLLGVLQGLTEFLPVSSSGHLVIAQYLMGWTNASENLAFDTLLHGGTLVSVFWFFRRDLLAMARGILRDRAQQHLAGMIVLGSVPTAAIGLGFEKRFEALFSSPGAVCVALTITAILLWAGSRAASAGTSDRENEGPDGGRSIDSMTWREAFVLGVVQGLAVTPGISRSGSTIAAALLLGFRAVEAGRFSFLLSIPAVGGAFLLHLRKILRATDPGISIDQAAAGFLASAITGLLALWLLMFVLKRNRLHWFAGYLIVAAGTTAAVIWSRG